MVSPIIAETLFSRPYKVQTKSEIASFRARDYSCLPIGYMLAACSTLLRAFFLIHVFTRSMNVPRFPALSSWYMFPRTRWMLHAFPRFLHYTCVPALAECSTLSCAFFMIHVFPRSLNAFPRFLTDRRFPALSAYVLSFLPYVFPWWWLPAPTTGYTTTAYTISPVYRNPCTTWWICDLET